MICVGILFYEMLCSYAILFDDLTKAGNQGTGAMEHNIAEVTLKSNQTQLVDSYALFRHN